MPIESTLDKALDRSVALGYSNIGYAIRSRSWSAPDERSLAGRAVLVTGGTSGIGMAAVRQCAQRGARVHVLGHDSERLQQAMTELKGGVPTGDFTAEMADVGSLADVRFFCADFLQRVPRLDALVHNAGTFNDERRETAEGHEQTLAVHVLGPHLMTQLLAPALTASGDGRVVFVSSGGMYGQPLRSSDIEYREGKYGGSSAYARTKRMQVALAEMWAEQLRGEDIAVCSMHPGWVDTAGVRRFLPVFRALTRPFIRKPDQGADTLTWLLTRQSGNEIDGRFWHDRASRPIAYRESTRPTAEQKHQLWDYCEFALAGAS